MYKATAHLKSISPFSWGRYHNIPKKEREPNNKYEERTWIERCHFNTDDYAIISGDAFKKSLISAARCLGESIPGRGKSTYTKRFQAGIMVLSPVVLAQKRDDIQGEWVFVPSDGRPGGSTRVAKCFPYVETWEGILEVHVLDPEITEAVFERHLKAAGMFTGVGRYRPERGGVYGRFIPTDINWEESED